MEINYKNDKKVCEIWLANAEKNDDDAEKSLELIYKVNKAKGYMTVVYESGDRELYDSVLGLLAYNKKRTAQLETERKKRERTHAAR